MCVCVCVCVCVAQVAMASAVASLSSPPAMGVQWSNGPMVCVVCAAISNR